MVVLIDISFKYLLLLAGLVLVGVIIFGVILFYIGNKEIMQKFFQFRANRSQKHSRPPDKGRIRQLMMALYIHTMC